MTTFEIGQRARHPEHGEGTVVFVGSEYVGIELDDGQDVLLRMDSFECASTDGMTEPVSPAEAEAVPWPDSTFVPEPHASEHFLGSHWDPFFENAKDLLAQLPEILQDV